MTPPDPAAQAALEAAAQGGNPALAFWLTATIVLTIVLWAMWADGWDE